MRAKDEARGMKRILSPHQLAVTTLASMIEKGFRVKHEQVLPNLRSMIADARLQECDSLYDFTGEGHNLDIWTGEVSPTTKADRLAVLKQTLKDIDAERNSLKERIRKLKLGIDSPEDNNPQQEDGFGL